MATQKSPAKPAVRTTSAKTAVRKQASRTTGKASVSAKSKTPAKVAAKPATRTPVKAAAPTLKKSLSAIARPAVKLVAKPVSKPVAKAVVKTEKKAELKLKKIKQIRDSFTMPETEYEVLSQVKKACIKAGFEIKKSDLLRIGVSLIKNLDTARLKTLLAGLTPLKVGRPKK